MLSLSGALKVEFAYPIRDASKKMGGRCARHALEPAPIDCTLHSARGNDMQPRQRQIEIRGLTLGAVPSRAVSGIINSVASNDASPLRGTVETLEDDDVV